LSEGFRFILFCAAYYGIRKESKVAGVPSNISNNIFESFEFENGQMNEIIIKLIAFYERRM